MLVSDIFNQIITESGKTANAINEYLTIINDPRGAVYKLAYRSFTKGEDARIEVRDTVAKKYGVSTAMLDKAYLQDLARRLQGVSESKICPVCGCTPCNCTHIVKEGLKNPKDNPCWKGYHPVGTKKKNGKTVPNCVPEGLEDAISEEKIHSKLSAILKQEGFKGPYKLSQLPEWLDALQHEGDEDSEIMILGDDPNYDAWVLKGFNYGYCCGQEQGYQKGQTARQVISWANYIKEGTDVVPAANPEDTVSLDIPLLIRLLEYAREDAKTDMDLHNVAERLITLSAGGQTLSMNDYDNVIPGTSD